MNKHKQFIKDAYEGELGLSMGNEWKTEIEKRYPEFKEIEINIGDWLWCGVILMCVYDFDRQGDLRTYYVNGHKSKWFKSNVTRKATIQEVENALIFEAKKRGFKDGVKYRCLVTNTIHDIDGELSFEYEINSLYTYVDGCLHHKCYKNGKWAEIIDTITK